MYYIITNCVTFAWLPQSQRLKSTFFFSRFAVAFRLGRDQFLQKTLKTSMWGLLRQSGWLSPICTFFGFYTIVQQHGGDGSVMYAFNSRGQIFWFKMDSRSNGEKKTKNCQLNVYIFWRPPEHNGTKKIPKSGRCFVHTFLVSSFFQM